MKHNQIAGFAWSQATSNDLSGNLYKAVKLDANGAAVVAAATDTVVGIQQTVPKAEGGSITIESDGVALCKVEGTGVTIGSKVSITATGGVQDINGSDTVIGVALATGAVGDLISIKLRNL